MTKSKNNHRGGPHSFTKPQQILAVRFEYRHKVIIASMPIWSFLSCWEALYIVMKQLPLLTCDTVKMQLASHQLVKKTGADASASETMHSLL